MRTWLVLLAITSVALAGSTGYLAYQLHELSSRQADSVQATAIVATPVVTAPSVEAPPVASPSPERATTGAPGGREQPVATGWAANSGKAPSEADMKKMQADYAQRFLAQIADPQEREEVISERKLHLRHQFPRVDQALGLSPEEYSKFLELMSQQQVDLQEATSRCVLDPECRLNQYRGQPDPHSQEIANLLGPDRTQKFETYKNTLGEREVISQLRGRLGEAQRLDDDKAEQLITVLAQERDAIHREAMNNGTAVNGFSMGAGMVFAPNDGRPLDERMEAARLSSQRLRNSAAPYLNTEQLRAFDEIQEETLMALRRMLRNKELDARRGGQFSAVPVTSGN